MVAQTSVSPVGYTGRVDNKLEAGQLAVTERGTTLKGHTEEQVDLALKTLVLSGGSIKKAQAILGEEGLVVSADAYRYWRDVAFPSRYQAIRAELTNAAGDELAARAMQRAKDADEAEAEYIRLALEKAGEVSPDKLTKAALDLAKAKGENIAKSQLLRNRPTEIKETRDVGELLDALKAEGLLKGDPRTEIEAEVIEEVENDDRPGDDTGSSETEG